MTIKPCDGFADVAVVLKQIVSPDVIFRGISSGRVSANSGRKVSSFDSRGVSESIKQPGLRLHLDERAGGIAESVECGGLAGEARQWGRTCSREDESGSLGWTSVRSANARSITLYASSAHTAYRSRQIADPRRLSRVLRSRTGRGSVSRGCGGVRGTLETRRLVEYLQEKIPEFRRLFDELAG